MVKDGIRFCDVCDETIPKGTTYIMHVLPQAGAKLLISLNKIDDPETATSFTLDSDGNARLDICLDCKAHMGQHGEIIN